MQKFNIPKFPVENDWKSNAHKNLKRDRSIGHYENHLLPTYFSSCNSSNCDNIWPSDNVLLF